MENQHRQIKGYRELNQEEIDLMNEIKATGEVLRALVAKFEYSKVHDLRWVCIGETHLQQGVMALIRAVARPTTF